MSEYIRNRDYWWGWEARGKTVRLHDSRFNRVSCPLNLDALKQRLETETAQKDWFRTTEAYARAIEITRAGILMFAFQEDGA